MNLSGSDEATGLARGARGGPLKETFHFPQDLALRIPGQQGISCVGAVTDLRTGEGRRWVLAEFPPPGTPVLSIGERVPLAFSGPCLAQAFEVEADVALWSFNEAAFTYGFEVDRATKESLLGAIHRNRAHRVDFSHDDPVSITVESCPAGHQFTGTLQNLSMGGVGVTLSAEADAHLKSSYELLLGFELPGGDRPLSLVGRTRSRSMVGDEVRYGIQFLQERLADPLRQLEQVKSFVDARENAG